MHWCFRLNQFLSDRLTPAVKLILLINCGFFLLHWLTRLIYSPAAEWMILIFGEIPSLTVFWLNLWRPLTYMFVHIDIFHLAFNMLMLWFFASELEGRWGSRRFWTFYLVTGAGAGLLHAILMVLFGNGEALMIGASGALYGVLLAFAAYYPNQPMLAFFVFPVPVKYFVIFIIIASIMLLPGSRTDNVSHLTHLTGLVVAYFYLARYHHTPDITRWKWMN